MGKEHQRSNREVKKPKAKPPAASAAAQPLKGISAVPITPKKKA